MRLTAIKNLEQPVQLSEFISFLEKRAIAQENTEEDGQPSNTTSTSMMATKSTKRRQLAE